MLTSVLVPYRTDHGHRDRAWVFNLQRWSLMEDVEVIVSCPAPGRNAAEFNHPAAINQAAARATGDVLIVADADTSFDPDWVRQAVALVRDGAPWVLPRFYDQLTEPATETVLAGDPADPIIGYDVIWRGDSVSWSGLVVVPATGFHEVGGYDERWEKWGGDDVAFACSMNTLVGRVHRLEGAAIHLWHPRTHLDQQPQNQHDLMYRYLHAEGDPGRMRDLIAERT